MKWICIYICLTPHLKQFQELFKKDQSKIFPYVQYLAYLQLIFTSVINSFKISPIRDFSILAMFLNI